MSGPINGNNSTLGITGPSPTHPPDKKIPKKVKGDSGRLVSPMSGKVQSTFKSTPEKTVQPNDKMPSLAERGATPPTETQRKIAPPVAPKPKSKIPTPEAPLDGGPFTTPNPSVKSTLTRFEGKGESTMPPVVYRGSQLPPKQQPQTLSNETIGKVVENAPPPPIGPYIHQLKLAQLTPDLSKSFVQYYQEINSYQAHIATIETSIGFPTSSNDLPPNLKKLNKKYKELFGDYPLSVQGKYVKSQFERIINDILTGKLDKKTLRKELSHLRKMVTKLNRKYAINRRMAFGFRKSRLVKGLALPMPPKVTTLKVNPKIVKNHHY